MFEAVKRALRREPLSKMSGPQAEPLRTPGTDGRVESRLEKGWARVGGDQPGETKVTAANSRENAGKEWQPCPAPWRSQRKEGLESVTRQDPRQERRRSSGVKLQERLGGRGEIIEDVYNLPWLL